MRKDAFQLANAVASRLTEELSRQRQALGKVTVTRVAVNEEDLKSQPSYPVVMVLPHQQSAQIEGVDPRGDMMAQAVRLGVAVHVLAEVPNSPGGEGDALKGLRKITAAVQSALHGWRPRLPATEEDQNSDEWPEVLRYGQGEWVEIDGGIAEWREEFWTVAWWFGGAGYGC